MYYYIFELAGEDFILSRDEVLNIINSNEFIIYSYNLIGKYLFLSINDALINLSKFRFFLKKKFPSIVAFTCSVSEIIFYLQYDEGNNFLKKLDIFFESKFFLKKSMSFMIKSKMITQFISLNQTKKQFILNLNKIIGAVIKNKGYLVSLTNFDVEFKVYILNFNLFFCNTISNVNTSLYQLRAPKYKPFFSPGVIMPRIARLICNFAKIKKNDFVLDPFCGTCGLLLEASFLGAKIIGIDAK